MYTMNADDGYWQRHDADSGMNEYQRNERMPSGELRFKNDKKKKQKLVTRLRNIRLSECTQDRPASLTENDSCLVFMELVSLWT